MMDRVCVCVFVYLRTWLFLLLFLMHEATSYKRNGSHVNFIFMYGNILSHISFLLTFSQNLIDCWRNIPRKQECRSLLTFTAMVVVLVE